MEGQQHATIRATVRALGEATGGVVWLLDADGELADDSPSWRAFTGHDAGAGSWWDLVHNGDRAAVDAAWRDARSTGTACQLEHRLRRRGDRFTRVRLRIAPVADDGAPPAHWVASLTEVWIDEAVRRSEERLRLATTAAQVAVWEYDLVAGQMTRTENHDALFGIAPQPIWQYDLFTDATHPDDRAAAHDTVQAAIAAGGPDHYELDFRVVWPDGSVHWLSVSGAVVARAIDGTATLVRGALIDVTRLKAAEAELRAAVKVRDEFLQVASHELNTPLTPLTLELGHLFQLVAADPAADATGIDRLALVRHVAAASRQVERLTALVDDMLDVTRLSTGRMPLAPSEQSLSELIATAVAEHAGLAERAGCTLQVVIAPGVVGCVDAGRMAQVVHNLLDNAFKYGRGQPIAVELSAAGDQAELVVRDHGIGVAEADLPRIFDKFERADAAARHYGGLGLGLYLARQIVEGHGGRIAVTRPADAGAAFTVTLPLRPR